MFFANALRMFMAAFLPVITLPHVSRALGPETLGEHQIASSFAMYFITFAAFGIPLFGQRETSAVRHQPDNFSHRVTNLYAVSIVIAIISYSALIKLPL
jgi:O-antigen/teichoic acid export membrane protein